MLELQRKSRLQQKRDREGALLYENQVKTLKFVVGQKVWLYHSSLQNSHSANLKPKWEGPYIITDAHALGGYAITKDGDRNNSRWVNQDNSKLYKS